MVCVNNFLNRTTSVSKHIRFNTAHNYSTVYHSMLDKSYDVFVSSEKGVPLKTNPLLEAVKKAVPFEKPRFQFSENMHDTIVDITRGGSPCFGKDASAFPIPNYPNLILRAEHTALEDLSSLSRDLELVPISFDKEIADNPHLGIPLYFVTSKGSTLSKKVSISPLEAVSYPNKIMVLKKVTGQHPAYECGKKFLRLLGLGEGTPNPDMLNNFSYTFGYVKKYFGPKAAAKCLEYMKADAKEIPEGVLAEGSEAFEIVRGKEFYDKYKEFADSYVEYLESVASMPDKAYEEAVKIVSASKKFNMDFQHTNNTFVDLEKQEFNFIDFAYNKDEKKYIYGNPVKSFRNVLYGKGFRKLDPFIESVQFLPNLKYPTDCIITPEHIKPIKKCFKVINEKVNASAPQELRSDCPF